MYAHLSFWSLRFLGYHWDGPKDEGAVLLITGEGPATTTRVPFEEPK